MNVIIKPKKLSGTVIVPPSKSLLHRAIIAASLANGVSVIKNVSYSKDIEATIKAMQACGANIDCFNDHIVIKGSKVKRLNNIIDCNESGSTMRFMIPIALLSNEPITFVGHNHLVKRPLDIYFEIFDKQGIKYKRGIDYLPLEVEGNLKSGEYELRGDVSSQFVTGLLFALPLLEGDSHITITTKMESIGYIDLTLDILDKFGIEVVNKDYKEFYIKGKQAYKPLDYTVEGDYSQAAFFLVADMLGCDIKLKNMNKNSLQGDSKILKDIEALGGKITFTDDYLKADPLDLSPATIDFSQSPDLGPALTVLCSLINGKSEFINAERLRIKECDRITCMCNNLNLVGANIEELPSGMIINGVKNFTGGVVDSYNDHRIAMAMAVASCMATEEIKILNSTCVNKSYPDFYHVFESIGGDVTYEK